MFGGQNSWHLYTRELLLKITIKAVEIFPPFPALRVSPDGNGLGLCDFFSKTWDFTGGTVIAPRAANAALTPPAPLSKGAMTHEADPN